LNIKLSGIDLVGGMSVKVVSTGLIEIEVLGRPNNWFRAVEHDETSALRGPLAEHKPDGIPDRDR